MRILALYASKHGQAEAVLRRVADGLEAAGHSVRVVDAKHIPLGVRPEHYEAVVIAASVILGHYAAYLRRFIRAKGATLAGRPTALISVSGTAPESSPAWRASAERYVRHLLTDTGWTPRWTAMFAGAMRYTRYDLVTRWVMRKIAEHEGGPTDTSRDHEFTDWAAVDRFGAQLARELSREPVGATG